MSSDTLSRRSFLRGGFLPNATKRASSNSQPSPVVPETPVPIEAPLSIEEARAAVRAQVGPIRRPDQKPFDIFTLLESLDANPNAPIDDGVARILFRDCLAFLGSFCSVCEERCPVEGALRIEGGKPLVDEALCTGCGQCQYVCPAPLNAVHIVPRPVLQDPPEDVPDVHQ
jgi:ferredoxin